MDQPLEHAFASRRNSPWECGDITLVTIPAVRLQNVVATASHATNIWLASIERRDRVFDGDFQERIYNLLCRSVGLGAGYAHALKSGTLEQFLFRKGEMQDKERWILLRGDWWEKNCPTQWCLKRYYGPLSDLQKRVGDPCNGLLKPASLLDGERDPAYLCGVFKAEESETMSCIIQEEDYLHGDCTMMRYSVLEAVDAGWEYLQ